MGRFAVVMLLGSAVIVGAAIWFLQTFYYYERLSDGEVLILRNDGQTEALAQTDFEAIDATSSPIRYRACFQTELSLEELDALYTAYADPEPRTGPYWFDCYDADEIGEALGAGEARAFMGEADIQPGIDRVVGVLPDGSGMVWHQINRCGEALFDGQPAPEGC